MKHTKITEKVDFAPIDDATLIEMARAADEVEACMGAAQRGGSNIAWDILRFEDEIVMWDHYPDDEVKDPQSGSQYYYHSHRDNEHGHFHCFLMEAGIPAEFSPVENQRLDLRDPDFTETFCHLVAMSMDEFGQPVSLFTTNRWVTQEVVYPAEQVISMLELFSIDHSFPAWTTNRWLTAMIKLYKPHITQLLLERDEAYRQLHAQLEDENSDDVIYEHKKTEILSECKVDVTDHIRNVRSQMVMRNLTL